MQKLFLITAIIMMLNQIHNTAQTQNLVPNPSFEQYTICPSGQGEVLKATGWHSYSGSPDYFNSCNGGTFSVPSNAVGYQPAATGNAYAGMYPFSPQFPNSREYIGIQLLSPLQIGQSYNISFKVCKGDNTQIDCACNKIGVLFSTISYSVDSNCPPPCMTINNVLPFKNYAHIYSSVIITDTVAWTVVSGNFTADSTYKFIIIGNFFDSSNITCIDFDTTNSTCTSYYLFDDISVTSLISIHDFSLTNLPFTYPNPVIDKINITIPLFSCNEEKINLKIYNQLGVLVDERNLLRGNNIITMDLLPNGIYWFCILSEHIHDSKKIIVSQ